MSSQSLILAPSWSLFVFSVIWVLERCSGSLERTVGESFKYIFYLCKKIRYLQIDWRFLRNIHI